MPEEKKYEPKKSIKGVFVPPFPQLKESKKGNAWCSFCIRTKTGLVACIAYGSTATAVCNGAASEVVVNLVGRGGEEGSFFVDVCDFPSERQAKRDSTLLTYGSKEEARKARAKDRARLEAKGLVEVTIRATAQGDAKTWMPKENCTFKDGRWQSKVEYLMDTLGTETVNREFREWAKTGMEINSKNKLIKRFDMKSYQEMVERLMEMTKI